MFIMDSVAVVVATYNVEQYVEETLESIYIQDFPEIELIITDDCSTDNTIAICEKWLKKNKSRFSSTKLVKSNTNQGIPTNCNQGISHAKSKWIKLIAGDDALEKDCISKNMNFLMKESQCQIVLSKMRSYYFTFLDSNLAAIYPSDSEIQRFFSSSISADQQYLTLLTGDVIANSATCFFRKSTWQNLNNYDEDLSVEDYPFWLKATKAGIKIHFFSDFTVKHRRHFNNNHFRANETLIHSAFMNYEVIRKKYIYPNINFLWFLHYKYQLYIAKFLIILTNNKKNAITFFLKKIIFSYLNLPRVLIFIFNLSPKKS